MVIRSVVALDREFIDHAPRLKAIGRAGTGTENVDLDYAAEKQIEVFTVPTGPSVSAAEFTVMQILNMCRRTTLAREMVAAGDFRRHRLEGRELSALTVGL